MDHLIEALENSLDRKEWFGALAIALMLPDACGKAEHPKAGNGDRYRTWFDAHITPMYTPPPQINNNWGPMLDGEIAWALRNAYLHAANTEIESKKIRERVSLIRFINMPNMHCNQFHTTLLLDISTFCGQILNAVKKWRSNIVLPFEDVQLVLEPDHEGNIYFFMPGIGRIRLSSH